MKIAMLIAVAAVLVAGCSVMPRGALKGVDRDITLDMVQTDPARYAGSKVLWGGIILNSENLEDATEIEILETELAFDERPKDGSTKGRFIVQTPGYLDTTIYSKNKRITVAGTVIGVERRRIGKMDYPYPMISPIDARVFEKMPEGYYDPYYYGPYGPYSPYGPYYPYGPFPPLGPPYRHPFYPYPYPFP